MTQFNKCSNLDQANMAFLVKLNHYCEHELMYLRAPQGPKIRIALNKGCLYYYAVHKPLKH